MFWVIFGLLLWSGVGLMILVGLSDSISLIGNVQGWEFVNPVYIYKNVKVNYFGAIVIAIAFTVICPIGAFCHWFYKLCIVGRK